MNSLIIYDDNGKIFSNVKGDYALPQGGIQYLEVEVPGGKKIVGVDVSVSPHQAILADIPPTENEQLRLEMAESNAEMFELIFGMNGGV
ncbi:hypothetical protein [Jeotgalibacillus malaysiensis]|uniref:hypothetical protein n=1 Tax=Jeotgalibacillus malaysiensis TaxID=1508404 RepID=UPI00384CBFEF